MATSSGNFIYVGRLELIDTDESDSDAENAEALEGLSFDTSDMQMTEVSMNDVNNDGAIYDDEYGAGDTVSYSITNSDGDTEEIETAPDVSMVFQVKITEGDGTESIANVMLSQMPNGDTFLVDLSDGALDNKSIASIELLQAGSSEYAGFSPPKSVDNSSIAVCFAAGTLIATPEGTKSVDSLQIGDHVLTFDGRVVPVRWIGSIWHARPGRHAPIEIPVGALGGGLPQKQLRVSPQHRVLVRSPAARRITGSEEVLVPAKRFLGFSGISQREGHLPVAYYHVLLDRHEVLWANGVPMESLLLGPMAQRALDDVACEELCLLGAAAEGTSLPNANSMTPVRPIPDGRIQKKLIEALKRRNRGALDPPPSCPAGVFVATV